MEEPSLASSFDLSRALGHAFGAVRIAAGPLWLGGMLLSMSDCGGGRVPTSIPFPDSNDEQSSLWQRLPVPWSRTLSAFSMSDVSDAESAGWIATMVIAAVAIGLAIAFGMFALNAWLSTGFVRLQVSILEHGGDALGPLFSGRDRLWPMMGYKLLATFSVSATLLVTAWPGGLLAYFGFERESTALGFLGIGLAVLMAVPAAIYVGLGTYLGELAVVLDQASPSQALRRSFELAGGGRWMLFLFAFVCALVEGASVFGIILCCVGVLATVPLARAVVGFAKTESYLLLTRGYAQTETWFLWNRDKPRV